VVDASCARWGETRRRTLRPSCVENEGDVNQVRQHRRWYGWRVAQLVARQGALGPSVRRPRRDMHKIYVIPASGQALSPPRGESKIASISRKPRTLGAGPSPDRQGFGARRDQRKNAFTSLFGRHDSTLRTI